MAVDCPPAFRQGGKRAIAGTKGTKGGGGAERGNLGKNNSKIEIKIAFIKCNKND
jgi:hypothetical protein